MFIDRGSKTPPAPFGGAEGCGRGEALVEFRSSERSRSWVLRSVYKYLTPNRVKTLSCTIQPDRLALTIQSGTRFQFMSTNESYLQ